MTFAISAAPAAIPPKPKMPAMIAMIKNVTTHLSIVKWFFGSAANWHVPYREHLNLKGDPRRGKVPPIWGEMMMERGRIDLSTMASIKQLKPSVIGPELA